MKIKAIAGAALIAMWAGAASAATVTIGIEDIVDDTDGPYVSVTCVSGCQGLNYLGILNDSFAEAVPGAPASDKQVVKDFSNLTGIDKSLISVAYKIDGDRSSFSVGPGYFFIKKADWRAFFFTTDGTAIRTSKDISNYGEIDVIPLPAAGWMLLAGFGGLVAMRRKKSA